MIVFSHESVAKSYFDPEIKFAIFLVNQDDESDEIWGTARDEEEAKYGVESLTAAYDSPKYQFYYKAK